jgi:hypothetical protein
MILVVATIRIISQISTGFLLPSEFPHGLTHLLAPIRLRIYVEAQQAYQLCLQCFLLYHRRYTL